MSSFKCMAKLNSHLKLIIIIAVSSGFLFLSFYLNNSLAAKKYKPEVDPLTSSLVASNLIVGSNLAAYDQAAPDEAPNISTSSKTNTDPAFNFKGFSENIPILMYHYVETPPATTTLKGLYLNPSIFDDQLRELKKNNYQTLFVSEAAASLRTEKKLDVKTVVLTFDDGYEDFYSVVWPLLKKYNCKATLYVIINKLGAKGYITRDQIRELASSGLVEIGSHTFNHPDLRNLKKKDAQFEIQASKKILEQISGQPVLTFAYPFGYYKFDFFGIMAKAGYTAAVSVQPGSRQGGENIWLLRRLRPNERRGESFIKWLDEWRGANK